MLLLLATEGPDDRGRFRSSTLWSEKAVIFCSKTRPGPLDNACHLLLPKMSPSAKLSVTRISKCREQRASDCRLRPRFRDIEKQVFRMPVNSGTNVRDGQRRAIEAGSKVASGCLESRCAQQYLSIGRL